MKEKNVPRFFLHWCGLMEQKYCSQLKTQSQSLFFAHFWSELEMNTKFVQALLSFSSFFVYIPTTLQTSNSPSLPLSE